MNSTKPFATVCSTDPAVDQRASDRKRYLVTRDQQYLKFHTGMEPAIYHVRRIPRSLLMKYVEPAGDIAIKFARAFECALVRVDRLWQEDGTQAKLSWEPEWVLRGRDTAQVMTDEEVEHAAPPEDQIEIGWVAYSRSFLHPGREVSYVPQPMLAAAYERATYPRAAEILNALPKINVEAQEALAPRTDETGDSVTAATAKANGEDRADTSTARPEVTASP